MKILRPLLLAAALLGGTALPALASNCRAPERHAVALAQATQQLTPQQAEALAAPLAEAQAVLTRATPDTANFWLPSLARLADAMAAQGNLQAAQAVAHSVLAADACVPERRFALLQPHTISLTPLHPLQQGAMMDVLVACAAVTQRQLHDPRLWSTCRQQALASADRAHAQHVSVHHAVADAMCAVTADVPGTLEAVRAAMAPLMQPRPSI